MSYHQLPGSETRAWARPTSTHLFNHADRTLTKGEHYTGYWGPTSGQQRRPLLPRS